MRTLVLGPTFTFSSGEPPERLRSRLARWADHDCPFEARHTGDHFQFAIRREERHRWSPWVTAETRPAPNGSELFVRINPSPAIWTAYVLASLAIITTALGALIWASAQLMLSSPPHALWIIPVCFALLAVMWAISAAGQRLAATEMKRMRQEIERVTCLA